MIETRIESRVDAGNCNGCQRRDEAKVMVVTVGILEFRVCGACLAELQASLEVFGDYQNERLRWAYYLGGTSCVADMHRRPMTKPMVRAKALEAFPRRGNPTGPQLPPAVGVPCPEHQATGVVADCDKCRFSDEPKD